MEPIQNKQEKASSSKLFEIFGNHINDSSRTDIQSSTSVTDLQVTQKTEPSLKNRFLYSIPWILFLAFIFSFFIDLDSATARIFGYNIGFNGFIRILSISGLIGFLTNWIAITMLFRPQFKRPLLGQGLIPAQKIRIAEKLSNAVNKNLINPDQIRDKLVKSGTLTKVVENIEISTRKLTSNEEFKDELFLILTESVDGYLSDPGVRNKITDLLLEHIESSFEEKTFERYAFKIYKNLRTDQIKKVIDNAIVSIPQTIYQRKHDFDDVLNSIPDEISNQRENIESFLIQGIYDIMHKIDLKSIIEENLNNYDEGRLEDLIRDSTIDQLNYIKYLGAVLGLLGGLIIWNPVIALVGLTSIGVTYFLLDEILFRIGQKKS